MTEVEMKAKAWDILYDTLQVEIDHWKRMNLQRQINRTKFQRFYMDKLLETVRNNSQVAK